MESTSISPAEWEVMRVAWTMKKTTSSEINGILAEKMDWKPATTKTLIGRLVKKGLLETETEGRKYIYSPTISEEESVYDSGHDFLSQICSTKVGRTLAQLIEDSEISQSDIKEIERVLEKKKAVAPEKILCDCIPDQCNCHVKGAGS